MSDIGNIATMEVFLAHALALEQESVERYTELADNMQTHNNDKVAEFFHRMARFGELHAAEVLELAKPYVLPEIPPWEFQWIDGVSPEAGDYDGTHYLMDVRQALEFARYNEARGRDFYAAVAERSPDREVRETAADFRDEEAGHVEQLDQWIARTPATGGHWDEDWDPANMPE